MRSSPPELLCHWDFPGKDGWVAIATPESSQLRDRTCVSCISLHWQADSLQLCYRKPPICSTFVKKNRSKDNTGLLALKWNRSVVINLNSNDSVLGGREKCLLKESLSRRRNVPPQDSHSSVCWLLQKYNSHQSWLKTATQCSKDLRSNEDHSFPGWAQC